MKKIYMILAAITLLSMSLNAQTSVTVCDGTSTSEYVPFYGFYFDDNYQIDQMIYPESLLTNLVGKTISSVTFYANSTISNNLSSGKFTFKIGTTTSQTTFSSPITRITTGMTTVATGMSMSSCISGNMLVIDFSDNPFTYQGGNLVLDYQLTTRANGYNHTYFYGENNHTDASFHSRGTGSVNSYGVYGTNTTYSFLPKVAFGIASTDPTISVSPTSVSMNAASGSSATETVTVTGRNLTSGISYSLSGTDASLFSVSPENGWNNTSGGTLTITYSPTTAGTHTATLTLSSTGADPVTITINGTSKNEVTVCDGSASSSLPVYGTWYDSETGQKNQMIYPASELTSLVGKDITSMTFYAPSGISFSGGSVTFSIGTTSTNAFSSATALTDNVTAVATVVPNGETEWTITFSSPYTYNGGNLLIQVDTETGSYGSTSFTGMNMGSNVGYYSYTGYSGVSNNLTAILPKVTFAFEESGPKITVSPETQTINDATAGTLTVTGTNIDGNISVSAGNDWSLNPTSLTNNGGDVSVTYTGRDLSASTTVTASATGATDATATVNYVADLYIVGDFGSGWDFNNGTPMSYNNGTYTATITANANSYILFARLLGNNNPWNTRDVFGPDSNGNWVLNGDSGQGTIDTNDDDPIQIVNGGTYTVTIDASNGTFTIERLVPALTAPTDVNVGTNQGAGASTTVNISGSNLTQDLTVSVSGTGFSVSPTTLTAADVMAGTTVTVTYNGTDPNATGTLTIGSNEVSVTVDLTASYVAPTPELIAPVDDSTVDVGTNHGNGVSKTITITGSYLSQDLTVSVSGSGFSISRDITISAADANAGTDITVTYNGTNANATGELTISSSEVSATVHLTASYAEITDLTVCDGQYYAQPLPVFGYFYDESQHNQMVYPASMLTDMVGKNITSMTFYPTGGWFDEDEDNVQDSGEIYYGINFSGGSVTFKLMNLSSGTAAFADENPTLITGTMTPVATVTPEANTSATTWEITFDTPFEYTGGDLLIDVTTTAGNYSPSFFTVDAVDSNLGAYNASYNGTNYRYGVDFLPKVTFNFGSMPHVEGGVIHLGHLPIVDQFAKSTAKNEHEVRYGYILVYEPDGEDAKESGKVEVPVEHTGSVIGGFYTAQAVSSDVDRHLKLNIINADVKMTLSDANPNITEYRIQSNEGGLPQEEVFLDKMNHMGNFTYMNWTEDENSPYYNDPVDAGEYHYYDSIPVVDGRTWGSSFKTYLPTVETWGIDRRYYETDHKNNTYGAPIWKTGVGKVDVVALKVEKQQNATTGSTAYASWTDGNGADCNLYMIDGLHADGYLPKSTVSNVEYAPYMFRIFVESPTNMLRGFKWFAASGDNPSHFENDPEFNNYGGPWCIYEENVEGATVVDLDDGGRGVKWYLNKNLSDWEDNARFGALSTLIQGTDNNNLEFDPNNLKVYVRFYYKSTGNPEMVEPSRATRGAGNMFYASEGSKDPQPWTAVTELQYYGEVESVTYYNAQGMQSSRPFDGVNIVVTRYSDGTTRTTKIIR